MKYQCKNYNTMEKEKQKKGEHMENVPVPQPQQSQESDEENNEIRVAVPVPKSLQEYMEFIPEDKRGDFFGALITVERSYSSFRGPLPHPDLYGGYENVLPGSAERILAMAEYQQKEDSDARKEDDALKSKSLDNEHDIIKGVNRSRLTGQWLAFIFLILISGGLLALIYLGHTEVTYVFYVLAAIAGVLIYKNVREERSVTKEDGK